MIRLNVKLIAAATLVIGIIGFATLQNFQNTQSAAKIETPSSSAPRSSIPGVLAENVYLEDGMQIIEVRAKGGYKPLLTSAKSTLPTILRMVTNDTFDCSSSVIIPVLQLRKRLPLSGSTDIRLPTIPENTQFTVYCGMGMYSFNLQFVG